MLIPCVLFFMYCLLSVGVVLKIHMHRIFLIYNVLVYHVECCNHDELLSHA